MDLLPDDMVASILWRLAPCSLAASRCVRKKWCAIIDTQLLLRADLLPLRLDAFFFLAEEARVDTYFFSRPSTGRRISGGLTDFLPVDCYGDKMILDHCNGLLLLWELVANPATRQSVRLPPFPQPCLEGFHRVFFFLAYDPIVSPHHYEVLLIPLVPITRIGEDIKIFKEESEWPPSTFTTHVFSSTKWKWEERSFVRQGNAAGIIADMCSDWHPHRRHAVYFRGALYVHCQNDSVMRITLRNDKYQMISSPAENQELVTYLGKSEKGVYYALLSQGRNRWPRFRVWLLNESCGQMVWVLKTDTSLQAMVENFHMDYTDTPWIVHYKRGDASVEDDDESEWDFDGGVVLHEAQDKVATHNRKIVFLGFHPYKEIAFFFTSLRVVSYHLNNSKVQELGSLHEPVDRSFPYTACWMGELLSKKN